MQGVFRVGLLAPGISKSSTSLVGIACTWSEVQGHAAGMRSTIFALAIALSVTGCESKKSASEQAAPKAGKPKASVPLVDLTTASSLAAVRTAFNAHKGEARFLTLLSPT